MTTNKQDVRRYVDMGTEQICPINNLRESDDGNYVLYEDYKALQAENDELREKLAAMENQEPVAWGAFYFGGKYRGQLYSHTLSEEQIEDYIAYVHRSNDSITLRKGPLYTKPVPADKPANGNGTGNVLWSDSHNEDEILEEHSDNVLFDVVANLWEDIRCLKEDKPALAVTDSLISDIEFVCNAIQNETAMQVCCGRPAWIECCGSPDVDWPSWATEAMTKLSSVRDSLIEATLSHSQQRCNIGNAESHDKELQVTIEHNGKIFSVDESISEFVQLLNSVGLETVASCSGHGHRPANIALKDGREIIIARNYEEGREIDRIFPVDINGDRCPSHKSEQQIPECFKKLTRHAVGMCFGTDWNNGTAATIHRENLINSAWECDKYLSENSHESEQGKSIDDLPGMWCESDLSGGWADSCNQQTEGKGK